MTGATAVDETVIGSMRSMDDGAVRALRVLVSPESLAEAHAAIAGGAHIVDVKNTREGS
ncbi:MAG: hypothetical protein KIT73_07085, partial [Burkholderiales bacterium]|nr:hypothetical protein [Burkholderiales bacterium]